MTTYGLPASIPVSRIPIGHTISGSKLLFEDGEMKVYKVMLSAGAYDNSMKVIWNIGTKSYLYDSAVPTTLFLRKMQLPISLWVEMMYVWESRSGGCITTQRIFGDPFKTCSCLHCSDFIDELYECEHCDHSETDDPGYIKYISGVRVYDVTHLIGYTIRDGDVRYWYRCVDGEVTEAIAKDFILGGESVDGSYMPGRRSMTKRVDRLAA